MTLEDAQQKLRNDISAILESVGMVEVDGPTKACTDSDTPYVVWACGAGPKLEGEKITTYSTSPEDIANCFRLSIQELIHKEYAAGKRTLLWRRRPVVEEGGVDLRDWDLQPGYRFRQQPDGSYQGEGEVTYSYKPLIKTTARFAFE